MFCSNVIENVRVTEVKAFLQTLPVFSSFFHNAGSQLCFFYFYGDKSEMNTTCTDYCVSQCVADNTEISAQTAERCRHCWLRGASGQAATTQSATLQPEAKRR